MYCAVRALNSLQKSMAFSPREPNTGPIGGDGEAWPAGQMNFTAFEKTTGEGCTCFYHDCGRLFLGHSRMMVGLMMPLRKSSMKLPGQRLVPALVRFAMRDRVRVTDDAAPRHTMQA